MGGDALSKKKTYYLPDFYLPDYKYWIEIKPSEEITNEERVKISEFNRRTDNYYLLIGEPYQKKYVGKVGKEFQNHLRWGKCPITNRLDLYVDGRWAGTESIDCNECKAKSDCFAYNSTDGQLIGNGRYHGGACFPYNGASVFEDSSIMKAYSKARSERFYHNEKG